MASANTRARIEARRKKIDTAHRAAVAEHNKRRAAAEKAGADFYVGDYVPNRRRYSFVAVADGTSNGGATGSTQEIATARLPEVLEARAARAVELETFHEEATQTVADLNAAAQKAFVASLSKKKPQADKPADPVPEEG